MKAGEVYRSRESRTGLETGGDYHHVYVVVNDYGVPRPLNLVVACAKYELNMSKEVCRRADWNNKNGFYGNEEKIADSLEDYYLMVLTGCGA